MKIGNIEITNNVALGPMAGVTDLPFRRLCREMGCGLVYTEMVSAKAILYGNKNTDELLRTDENEHPIAVQLFGSDPDIMADIASRLEEGPYDFIDINMGCPVPKIVNNKEGSALMKDPKLAGKIVNAIAKKCKKPVTVKFRKGFNDNMVNAVEMAKIMEANGAAAVAVHGRTREQYYSGVADWDIIRQVKEAVDIPVIGNGDITSAIDGKKMLDETGCDGIMIGRAARGNPWLFKQTVHYLKTGELLSGPETDEIKQMLLRHAKMLIGYKGEFTGIREMRKHVSWYITGLPHAASIRNAVNMVESYDELEKLINISFCK
ncbi:MAG: tRNA dihydrouridine synthase DusB [Lachnospiraceae bacterium]|nr:tRNA dihydrouridine synthase DusB [Lachnospiraceae bacterium]